MASQVEGRTTARRPTSSAHGFGHAEQIWGGGRRPNSPTRCAYGGHGWTHGTVSRIENRRAEPTLSELVSLIIILGSTFEELLDPADDREAIRSTSGSRSPRTPTTCWTCCRVRSAAAGPSSSLSSRVNSPRRSSDGTPSVDSRKHHAARELVADRFPRRHRFDDRRSDTCPRDSQGVEGGRGATTDTAAARARRHRHRADREATVATFSKRGSTTSRTASNRSRSSDTANSLRCT